MKNKIVSYDDVQPREGGKYSLYCYTCGRWIPNTANYEMRKEGCFAHSHSCCEYEDGSIEIFGERGEE